MPPKLENLNEHVVANPSQVDREAGIIFGVKIIGRISRNNREYAETALQRAAGLYEGKQVNLNHPNRDNPNADRQVSDRFGKLQNIIIRRDGLFGDLHFLKSHPLAEQVCEAAERMPEVLGLSHNADGRSVRKHGKTIIEEIERVISVDLVCDPATTGGLFESIQKGTRNMISCPQGGKKMAKLLNKPDPWTNHNNRVARQLMEGNDDIGDRTDKDAEKTRELLTKANEQIEQTMKAVKEVLSKSDLTEQIQEAGLNAMQSSISALVEDELLSNETEVADEAVVSESTYNYHLRRSRTSLASRQIIESIAASKTRLPNNGADMASRLR